MKNFLCIFAVILFLISCKTMSAQTEELQEIKDFFAVNDSTKISFIIRSLWTVDVDISDEEVVFFVFYYDEEGTHSHSSYFSYSEDLDSYHSTKGIEEIAKEYKGIQIVERRGHQGDTIMMYDKITDEVRQEGKEVIDFILRYIKEKKKE